MLYKFNNVGKKGTDRILFYHVLPWISIGFMEIKCHLHGYVYGYMDTFTWICGNQNLRLWFTLSVPDLFETKILCSSECSDEDNQ